MKVQLRKKKLSGGTISIYLDYSISGKRIRETLQIYIYKNDKDAKEKKMLSEKIRAQREIEISSGSYGFVPSHKKKVDFFYFFESFNKDYGKKDYRRFEATLKDLKRFCGYVDRFGQVTDVKPLQSNLIDETFCVKFKDYLITKHRGATSFNYFKAFKRVLNEAAKQNIFLKSPAENVKNKNTVDGKLTKEVLYDDEISLLLKTFCGNHEVKRAFLFALFTGLRSVDIRSLTWKQIDLNRNMLIFDQSKTDEQNFLPLNSTAVKLLGTPGKLSEKVFLLPSQNGTNKALNHWLKRSEIKKHITFHCARHSFITNLLIHGTDLKTASTAAGHTTTRHTERYTHISNQMKRKAVDGLVQLDI